jgi:hypothetical protein
MPVLLGCFAVIFPRLVLFLIWLLGNEYLERAYDNVLWLLLGFVFLPLTTLAYAYAVHSFSGAGDISTLGWLIVAVAALVDLGSWGGNHPRYRRGRELRRARA